ncbi:hypothetical protein C0991_000605 [Blastosporella zonata]|nr:hypothetical protein C0991_000605 [Blastosporella zonata]
MSTPQTRIYQGGLSYLKPNEKGYMSDPFLTDSQAKGLGLDATQQPTRRIVAKFLPIDPLSPSDAEKDDDMVPHILVTCDGEIIGRPITPSSSGHHQPHTLTGHTTNIQYTLDVKASQSPRESSPDTLGEVPSTTTTDAPSQAEITRRVRELLAQMQHHVGAPVTDSGVAAVQLQRQVEMLQRENEQPRQTGTNVAPPAYEGGRF